MERRKAFYAVNQTTKSADVHSSSSSSSASVNCSEERGEPPDHPYYTTEDKISLSIEYYFPPGDSSKNATSFKEIKPNPDDDEMTGRRYLRCVAGMPVRFLKKFIVQKYSLSNQYQVDLMYGNFLLTDDLSLMDVIYIYSWCSVSILLVMITRILYFSID